MIIEQDAVVQRAIARNKEWHLRVLFPNQNRVTAVNNYTQEHGYYDIPREAQLEDIATELDISHQALSERFHRAIRSLIENTLLVEGSHDGARR